ncbi:MAG: hypothetical protein U5L96_02935 [Owenweeksia sp.]|nr:hypothetical protein [Owenweeksia sp.]
MVTAILDYHINQTWTIGKYIHGLYGSGTIYRKQQVVIHSGVIGTCTD